MTFQPDYHYMLDVLANLRPARLPIYEHIISPTIMEQDPASRSWPRRPGTRPTLRQAQGETLKNSSATTAAFGRR